MHVMRANTSSIAPNGIITGTPPVITESEKKPAKPKNKCFCLTVWLIVLLLLCLGVIVIVNFLLKDGSGPFSGVVYQQNDRASNLTECLESSGLSLEQKTALSALIVVGKLQRNNNKGNELIDSSGQDDRDHAGRVKWLRVQKTLKGKRLMAGEKKLRVPKHLAFSQDGQYLGINSPCHLSTDELGGKRIFFLSHAEQDIPVQGRNARSEQKWVPKFRPLPVSAKLTRVILSLVGETEDDTANIGDDNAEINARIGTNLGSGTDSFASEEGKNNEISEYAVNICFARKTPCHHHGHTTYKQLSSARTTLTWRQV